MSMMPASDATAGFRPIAVIVNQQGGAAAKAGPAIAARIVDAFAAHGRHAEVLLVDGCDIVGAVGRVAGEALVVVAGGDGTLACAAGAILDGGGKAALGILPLGTRNHLARELGIPLDLTGAVATIAADHRRAIDLGGVNDRVFVNNASIGIYPQLVRLRDSIQRNHGVPKWLAGVFGAWRALRKIRSHRLHIELGGERRTIRSPLLFVGNNIYSLEAGRLGQRRSLDEGTLSVFAVASRTAWGTVAMAVRTMIGKSDPERDFSAAGIGRQFAVSDGNPGMTIALDGEVHRFDTPLLFEILPAALTVVAPAPAVSAA